MIIKFAIVLRHKLKKSQPFHDNVFTKKGGGDEETDDTHGTEAEEEDDDVHDDDDDDDNNNNHGLAEKHRMPTKKIMMK